MSDQSAVIVDIEKKQKVKSLARVKLGKHALDESLLQQVLATSVDALPLDQFGPVFSPAICLGREIIKTDLLLLSAGGFITIVETKLWKNPEARRVAVAQVLEYAEKLSHWNYQRLEAAVQKKNGFTESLYDWASGHEEIQEELPSEQAFFDSVSKNLSAGHFLLLIVGDGIHEGLRDLTESLNQAPQLGFTFGLVEMICFRLEENQLVLIPNVVARTREIERAVVRIEMKPDVQSQLDVNVATAINDVTTSPGLRAFIESLNEAVGVKLTQELEEFSQVLESTVDEVEIVCNKVYIVKCHYSEGDNDSSLHVFKVARNGTVRLGGQNQWKNGTQPVKDVIEAFWNSVAKLLPGIRPKLTEKGSITKPGCELAHFLSHRNQLERIILDFATELNSIES